MKNKVYLHIGLHKTATTTLQKQLFPYAIPLNYIGNNCWSSRLLIDMLTKKDPMYFDGLEVLKLMGDIDNPDPILISAEALSGVPFAGEREWGLDHRKSVLENILLTFAEPSLILTIRRQDTLALSLYRQYLKFGGTQCIERFYGIDTLTDSYGLVTLDRFNYLIYIRTLHEMFNGRVLVLVFEELVKCSRSYLSKIESFVGIKFPKIDIMRKNETRFGEKGLEFSRLINFIFRSKHNPGGLIIGVPVFKKGKLRWINPMQYIHDYWPVKGGFSKNSKLAFLADNILKGEQKNNQVLDSEFRLGLEKYGYF